MAAHNEFNLGLAELLENSSAKIMFIRLIRESCNITLAEAKNTVDQVVEHLNSSPQEDDLFLQFSNLRADQQDRLAKKISKYVEVVEF